MARKTVVEVTREPIATRTNGRRRMERYSPSYTRREAAIRTFEDRLAREREERDPKNVSLKLRERIVKILERFATETIEHEHLPVLRGLAAETLSENEGALTEWITIAETVADAAEEAIGSVLRERKRIAEEVRLEAERLAKEEKELKEREEVLERQLTAMLGADYKWWREGSEDLYPHLTCRTAGHLLDRRPPSGWQYGEERPWNRTEVEAWMREVEAILPSLEATRLVRRLSREEEAIRKEKVYELYKERRAVAEIRIEGLTCTELKRLPDEEIDELKRFVEHLEEEEAELDSFESFSGRRRRSKIVHAPWEHVRAESRRRDRFSCRISDLLEHYEEHVEPRRECALNHEARHAKWRGGRPGKHARRGHRHGSDTDPRREWRRDARRTRPWDKGD